MYATVAADKRTKISGTSSFVTALYNDSKTKPRGMVLGFLNHTHWKSGIEYSESTLSAVAGINGELLTRDKEPHGMVSTDIGPCPVLMIGVYDDWRDGMEEVSSLKVHTLVRIYANSDYCLVSLCT
jgi:hypothetical protein